ncbi:hypothetical protein FRC04_000832 [Tulasnella sp. 424]|nr:hypothetical protein FRC04_000832 [Tulasnella sp. 424]KAG8969427.1 hypothetical protein FRC05_001062 [Tulasnella sp. 425]
MAEAAPPVSTSDREALDEPVGENLDSSKHQYILPADAPEHQRLDLQQELLTRVRDGLFLHKDGVYHALTPKPGDPKPVVLDLGCGSGFWAMEMARQFPDVDVIGIDLVVPTPTSPIPTNCRFEQHELNNGLAHYRNAANVIHASCICQGITDNRQFLDEVWKALRPGGVYLVVAGDMQMLDENKKPWIVVEGRETFKGPGILAYPQIAGWLNEMGPELWEEIDSHDAYVPIGPWKENMTESEKQTGELMRQNMLRLHTASRFSLHAYGIPEETVNAWVEVARDELVNLRKHIYCHVG